VFIYIVNYKAEFHNENKNYDTSFVKASCDIMDIYGRIIRIICEECMEWKKSLLYMNGVNGLNHIGFMISMGFIDLKRLGIVLS